METNTPQKIYSNRNIYYFSSTKAALNVDIESLLEKVDIIIKFHSTDLTDGKDNTLRFAQLLPNNKIVLIYEELPPEGEFGGGGPELLSFAEVIYFSLKLAGSIFLQEIGKEAYQKISKQFGKLIKESKYRSHYSLQFDIGGKKELIYIFQPSLNADEAIEAFQIMRKHSKRAAKELKTK